MTKFIVLFVFYFSISNAQVSDSFDSSFNIGGTGFNGTVTCIKQQSDGKILVGGYMTIYNAQTIWFGVVRLNSDGTKDNSFNINATTLSTGICHDIAIQPDGKIILVGDVNFGKKIFRLNIDGTIDTTFNVGTGFNQTTRSIALQPDGKLLVSGDFSQFNGSSIKKVARLNNDGTLDNSFVNAGTNFPVDHIILQPDGKILIGGNFGFNLQNIDVGDLMRLNSDGSVDSSFNSSGGFGLYGSPESIVIQANGKILVAGNSVQYNGVDVDNIIRLNSDGSLDSSFALTGTGINSTVYSIHLFSDGKILATGNFYYYNGALVNNIVLLNPDGSRDSSFNSGTGLTGTAEAICLQNDGKILIGGQLTGYNGNISNKLVRLKQSPLSINNNVKSLSAVFYPNPVKDFLKVRDLPNSFEKFDIYNNTGQCVATGKIENSSINVSTLSNGLYFLVLKDDSSKVYKFVKD